MGDFYVYHGIRLLGLMNDGKKSRRDHFAARQGALAERTGISGNTDWRAMINASSAIEKKKTPSGWAAFLLVSVISSRRS